MPKTSTVWGFPTYTLRYYIILAGRENAGTFAPELRSITSIIEEAFVYASSDEAPEYAAGATRRFRWRADGARCFARFFDTHDTPAYFTPRARRRWGDTLMRCGPTRCRNGGDDVRRPNISPPARAKQIDTEIEDRKRRM